MFASQQVLGLPVVTLNNGRKSGQIIDMIVNADENRVDYLLVSQGNKYLGLKVLPFKSLSGIGEHAVTVKNERTLKNLEESKTAGRLLNENIQLIGKEILMENGNLLGIVDEYSLDEKSGHIVSFDYHHAGEGKRLDGKLDAAEVLCYGFDVIVVKTIEEVKRQGEEQRERNQHNAACLIKSEKMQSEGAVLFKEKQRQFLIGKRLTRDIKGPGGKVILPQGALVTREILDIIEDNGMFMELTQYAR